MGKKVGLHTIYSAGDDQSGGHVLCHRAGIVRQRCREGAGSVRGVLRVVGQSAVDYVALSGVLLRRFSQLYMVQSCTEGHGDPRRQEKNTWIGDHGRELRDVGGRFGCVVLGFYHHLSKQTDGKTI